MKTWCGLGELRYADGTHYQGFTVNGRYQGRGRLTYPNGDVYQGDWVAGKPHGHGTFVTLSTRRVYDGVWNNGMEHGEAKETFFSENYSKSTTYTG